MTIGKSLFPDKPIKKNCITEKKTFLIILNGCSHQILFSTTGSQRFCIDYYKLFLNFKMFYFSIF